MKTLKFTTKTKKICEKNYDKNCGNCILRPECTKPVKELNEWVIAVNQLAEGDKNEHMHMA